MIAYCSAQSNGLGGLLIMQSAELAIDEPMPPSAERMHSSVEEDR